MASVWRPPAVRGYLQVTDMDEVFGTGSDWRPRTRRPAEPVDNPSPTPADKIEYARLLKAQGKTLGEIAAKTGILMTSLPRYFAKSTNDDYLAKRP